LTQGLVSFDPGAVGLLQIVNESLILVMEQAKNKNIEIVTDVPEDTAVFADSNMLQTVIRNLISNAVKFTPRGGKICLSAITSDEKTIEIAVKDTGIGMSSTLIDNLFRIDVQTNRKGTEGEHSTGLGLIICKDFIEKHGGKIRIESEEGKGSAFYFTISRS
jgi:signal transduction histidine kinase